MFTLREVCSRIFAIDLICIGLYAPRCCLQPESKVYRPGLPGVGACLALPLPDRVEGCLRVDRRSSPSLSFVSFVSFFAFFLSASFSFRERKSAVRTPVFRFLCPSHLPSCFIFLVCVQIYSICMYFFQLPYPVSFCDQPAGELGVFLTRCTAFFLLFFSRLSRRESRIEGCAQPLSLTLFCYITILRKM